MGDKKDWYLVAQSWLIWDLSRRGAGLEGGGARMCSIWTAAFLQKYHNVDNGDGRVESMEVATAMWCYAITSDEWGLGERSEFVVVVMGITLGSKPSRQFLIERVRNY